MIREKIVERLQIGNPFTEAGLLHGRALKAFRVAVPCEVEELFFQ
jgi:hypothetical protein